MSDHINPHRRYDNLDEKYVLKMIKSFEKESDELDKRCSHKDQYSNPHEKHLKQYRKLLEFLRFDITLSLTPENNALINDKFVFALNTNKWRNVDKWTWYKSYGPKQFIKTYVKAPLKERV